MSSKLDLTSATADYQIPRAGEPEEVARMLLYRMRVRRRRGLLI